jgi:hypothetical protein
MMMEMIVEVGGLQGWRRRCWRMKNFTKQASDDGGDDCGGWRTSGMEERML